MKHRQTTFTITQNQTQQIVIEKNGHYIIKLKGRGAHAEILGIFQAQNNDKINISIEVHHLARHTNATTHIRGTLNQKAHAQVAGLIKIFPQAQHTNSFLTQKILLISPHSHATAIPKLEIEADNVKASHAAAVAPINKNQLFYLQSRGLSKTQSTNLIAAGFLQPVKSKINQSKNL